jgi:hypothetical protein
MMMKSSRMKYVGHVVALTGQKRNAYSVFLQNLMERHRLGDIGLHSRKTVKLL